MTAARLLRLNVVAKRAELHLSQAALAQRAGVSRATVSKIEQGEANIGIAKLEKIAGVLHCRLFELFAPRARAESAEWGRRANVPDSRFSDARAQEAIDEASEARRYSNAGRRRRRVDR